MKPQRAVFAGNCSYNIVLHRFLIPFWTFLVSLAEIYDLDLGCPECKFLTEMFMLTSCTSVCVNWPPEVMSVFSYSHRCLSQSLLTPSTLPSPPPMFIQSP